jgi:hypothetical protein
MPAYYGGAVVKGTYQYTTLIDTKGLPGYQAAQFLIITSQDMFGMGAAAFKDGAQTPPDLGYLGTLYTVVAEYDQCGS